MSIARAFACADELKQHTLIAKRHLKTPLYSMEPTFEENPFLDCPCDPWGEFMCGYYYSPAKLLALCNRDTEQAAYHIDQCNKIGYPWVLSPGDHHPGWNRTVRHGEECQYFLPNLTPTENRSA